MTIVAQLKEETAKAIEAVYKVPFFSDDILVNQTKPEFEGDYTVVLFSLVKFLKISPEQIGKELGEYMAANNSHFIKRYNVIKGFLNLTLTDNYFTGFLNSNLKDFDSVSQQTNRTKIIVEYSSPNTNKPIHLGHLRNNFLGWSVAEILKVNGSEVIKTSIVNDRGIHICKSMVAWQLFANGATPESTGIKGDHFVGDYYVRFTQEYNKQIDELIQQGMTKEEAEKEAPVMQKAKQMLVDWENGKPEVIDLWQRMNNWVYAGFDVTYKRIGTDFHRTYYESDTFLLGKVFVEQGLEKGVFYRKNDGSVWVDLTAEGLDEKLVLRSDGTSVYITQDLGLAHQKYEEYGYDQSIYVIADEQNYHMKVLKLILKKLGMPYADGIFHLSYGMVELPTGKMKSREGTVVDADDIINEMVAEAEKKTKEHSKIDEFTREELTELYEIIGLGALKFYLLRVDAKKRMVFNPEESIDFHGFTGSFIQYTHARIKSILRKADTTLRQAQGDNFGQAQGDKEGVRQSSSKPNSISSDATLLLKLEKELIILLEQFPDVIKQAAVEYNPSAIAMYVYNIAKAYNSFYTEHSVLKAETEERRVLRLRLCEVTADVIKRSMELLGIRVPERM